MSELAVFSPRALPPETLEGLFVGREYLLERIIEEVTAAAESESRTHFLFLGPRGAGKTHLVALAYHRLRPRHDAGAGFRLSWLPEDPYSITSYKRFLKAVLDNLEPLDDLPMPTPLPDHDEVDLETLLRHAAGDGPIVVIAENLGTILDGIGPQGQRRLRGFIQTFERMMLVATATRLDNSLLSESEPFYGFFSLHRLEPFDLDTAQEMLALRLEATGRDKVAAKVREPQTRSRLAAVNHLAGGQPRIWALFSNALTLEGLDDLVTELYQQFDGLTPYYQHRLDILAPLHREIVIDMLQDQPALSVKDMAGRIDRDERSVSKAVGELVEIGWLRHVRLPFETRIDRRRSYYEIAEPLASLAMELKETKGKPIRAVVDFLKAWFDRIALDQALERLNPNVSDVARAHVVAAADACLHDESHWLVKALTDPAPDMGVPPTLVGLADDALAALQESGHPERLLSLPSPVRHLVTSVVVDDGLSKARLRLHLLAEELDDDAWRQRADQLLERAIDEQNKALLNVIRRSLRDDQFERARVLIDLIEFDTWEPQDIGPLAMTLELTTQMDLFDMAEDLVAKAPGGWSEPMDWLLTIGLLRRHRGADAAARYLSLLDKASDHEDEPRMTRAAMALLLTMDPQLLWAMIKALGRDHAEAIALGELAAEYLDDDK